MQHRIRSGWYKYGCLYSIYITHKAWPTTMIKGSTVCNFRIFSECFSAVSRYCIWCCFFLHQTADAAANESLKHCIFLTLRMLSVLGCYYVLSLFIVRLNANYTNLNYWTFFFPNHWTAVILKKEIQPRFFLSVERGEKKTEGKILCKYSAFSLRRPW